MGKISNLSRLCHVVTSIISCRIRATTAGADSSRKPQIEQQEPQAPAEDIEPSDESVPTEEVPTEVDNQIPEDSSAETDNGVEVTSSVLSDWIIAFFTGILVLVAYLQWRTSRTQGKILRSTERAYMQTVQWKLHNFAPEKPLHFSYVAKNFGRTPAVLLKTAFATVYAVKPPESGPVMQVVDEGRTFVNNGSGLNKAAKGFVAIGQQLHELVKKGETTLWIYVELSYLDTFKVKRVYKTCMKYNPETGKLVTAPGAKYDDAS